MFFSQIDSIKQKGNSGEIYLTNCIHIEFRARSGLMPVAPPPLCHSAPSFGILWVVLMNVDHFDVETFITHRRASRHARSATADSLVDACVSLKRAGRRSGRRAGRRVHAPLWSVRCRQGPRRAQPAATPPTSQLPLCLPRRLHPRATLPAGELDATWRIIPSVPFSMCRGRASVAPLTSGPRFWLGASPNVRGKSNTRNIELLVFPMSPTFVPNPAARGSKCRRRNTRHWLNAVLAAGKKSGGVRSGLLHLFVLSFPIR